MRLPTWDELIDEQRNVLDHPFDQPLFVVGPPGSGKTVLAISRSQMMAEGGDDVVVVTFNRMLRRLVTITNESGAIAKTMHSFVWHDYKGRTWTRPEYSPHDSFDYDWSAMLNALDGHPNSAPKWKHLVIDEGQDLAKGFFRYAHRHGAEVLTVFADEDQSLGERRTTLEEIKAAANLPDPFILSENHRNTPEIAIVAEHFHSGRLPAARVRRNSTKEIPRLVHSRSLDDTAQLITRWFKNRGGTIGVLVNLNSTGMEVYNKLHGSLPGRRVDIYTSKNSNEDTIELLEPGITVLNKESVKGQEFDTVFMLELERFIPCQTDVMRRVMYMMCARARDNLLLVYGPDALSPQANAALPGPHLLERK